MDTVREMHDKNYYSKAFSSDIKTKITLDMSLKDNDDISIIHTQTVDKFGRPLEKSVPFAFDDESTPEKSQNEDSESLKEELKEKDIKINELERQLTERDIEINKLKKKIEDGKSRAERQENRINKLLYESEGLRKTNTQIEERIRDFE